MYVQDLKPGQAFTEHGQTLTVASVTYVSGYHGRYVVKTTNGRTFTFYAGEQVTITA